VISVRKRSLTLFATLVVSQFGASVKGLGCVDQCGVYVC
jgi:hypothetical protein